MEGEFHFLALWHTTNSKEAYGITWPRGLHHFRLGVSRIFKGWIWRRLEWHKIWSFHGHGTIHHLGSIHFSYIWLYNWGHTFSTWPEGKSPRALHTGQTLPWRATPTQCDTMWFLCAPAAQLVDQPCTTLNFAIGSKIHHQKPQPTGFLHIRWLELVPTNYKAKETSLISYKHNRKTKRCLAHLCLLPKSTRLLGRWTKPDVLSCFSIWDEPSPKERERAMGFQTRTTSHNKVTKLECNAILGRSMDLNSFTWLLVTCVFFQMYTTPSLIQSTYSYGDVTTWHPDQVHLPIFNTLHFTFSVRGEEVPCNLIQVVSDTPGGTSASGTTITTFYESMQLNSGKPNTPSSSNTFSNSIPCVSNYPFVMGNQLTKKEKDQVTNLFIKYENVFAFSMKDLSRCKTM